MAVRIRLPQPKDVFIQCNKIIAFFLALCLCFSLICVPASAVDEPATMLYNGVELPNIETVWTGEVKQTYPYVYIFTKGTTTTAYYLVLYETERTVSAEGITYINTDVDGKVSYKFIDDRWDSVGLGNTFSVFWANTDVYTSDGALYLAATDPVPVPSSPSLSISSLHAGSDSVSSIVTVEGLASTESIYSLRADIFSNNEVFSSATSDLIAGPYGIWHVTRNNLTPETVYTLKYTLQENGVDTGVSVSQTFTTLPAVDSPVVDDTDSLSILSAILSAVQMQSDQQEQATDSIIHAIGMCWIRLRYIEEILATIGLSPAETALRNSVSESTQAVSDQIFADESPTKVTSSDVADVAQVGSAASQMFNPGVSVGDFFTAFNDASLVSFFSQSTYDALNTVPPSAITYSATDSGNSYVDFYSDNLSEIQQFVGGE